MLLYCHGARIDDKVMAGGIFNIRARWCSACMRGRCAMSVLGSPSSLPVVIRCVYIVIEGY